MTSPVPESCPRCHSEKSFHLAQRRSLVERLIRPWTRGSTLRCTRCGCRLHARLTTGDKDSLSSRSREAARRPVAVAFPAEEPADKGSPGFNALIEEMRKREQALTHPQDRPERDDEEGLAG